VSVSAVSSTPAPIQKAPPAPSAASAAASASATPPVTGAPSTPAQNVAPVKATVRAPDGDSKVRTAHTAQVKDSDGDYKVLKAGSSAAAQSSSAVQANLSALKKGG